MNRIARLNTQIQRLLSNLVGGDQDLTARTVRDMICRALEDRQRESPNGTRYAPNEVRLDILFDDDEQREQLEALLIMEELEQEVRAHAQKAGLKLYSSFSCTVNAVETAPQAEGEGPVWIRTRFVKVADAPVAGRPDTGPVNVPLAAANSAGQAAVASRGELLVRQHGVAPRIVALGRRTKIGRSPNRDNDLVTDPSDRTISGTHAQIDQEADGGYTLHHISQTNPTRVNDMEVDNRVLQDGDVIRIGRAEFVFQMRGDVLGEEATQWL